MLFTTPKLDKTDFEVIRQIDEAKRQLGLAVRPQRRWTGLLRRSTLGRAIRGSNSIEGYKFDRQDVVAAAQGNVIDANEETQKANEGYRRAMTHVLGMAVDEHFKWSDQVLKSTHFMLLEYDMDKNPGQWRPNAVFVFDEERGEQVYEGPDADMVPGLMAELVECLALSDPTVPTIVRAAMAHLNLVMIHPFKDGNGRMARSLQTLVLGRSGTLEPVFCSIEEYLGRHQYAYYDVLAQVGQGSWHPTNDALPFVRFCIRAHYYQAHTLLRRAQEAAEIWTRLEKLVQERGLPERTTAALWDAAQGFRVENATYRSASDVSQSVASRDLTALKDAGLLIGTGEKRGRWYSASQEILDVKKQVTVSRIIPDPYQQLQPVASATMTSTAMATTISGFLTTSSTGLKPHGGPSLSEDGDQSEQP